jgi:hypothetical protein
MKSLHKTLAKLEAKLGKHKPKRKAAKRKSPAKRKAHSPTRKTSHARKARRTPAQKAATKKLVALNKRRAGKTSHSPTKKRKLHRPKLRSAVGSWRVLGDWPGRSAAHAKAARLGHKRKARKSPKRKSAHSPTKRHGLRRPHVRRAAGPWTLHDWPKDSKRHATAARAGWKKVAKPGWKPKRKAAKKRAKKAHSPTRPRHMTHGHRPLRGGGMSYRKALSLL